MRFVAKVVIIDDDNKYLLLCRSGHPAFPNDPDLPGGIVEDNERPLQGAIREVKEEVGITLDPSIITRLYKDSNYSPHGTVHCLYLARVAKRPQVAISWEHSSYQWVELDDFLSQAKHAADTYMHMVYDVLSRRRARD